MRQHCAAQHYQYVKSQRCVVIILGEANQPGRRKTDKNVWIGKERNLWAKTFNIPMKDGMPGGFPILTLVLMRHLAALRQLDGNQNRLVELLDIFSRELWVNHADVHKPEVFSPILQKVLGNADAAKVAEAAAGPLKKLLNDNTDQAFNDQAFGLPWMVCTNAKGEKESFWGVDHMGQLALFLGLEKPTTRGWQAVL